MVFLAFVYLIAVEGIDGSGKTTIANFIKEELLKLGIPAVVLKEPTDGKYGKIIKESEKRFDPEKELELFILDRKEDVEKNILPTLNRGISVVMDRYYYSSVAYQGARGIDPEEILKMNESIAPVPDLTILLDVDPEIALKRIENRKKLTPFEDLDYLKKVREIFLSIKRPEIRIVDASRNLDDVKDEVIYHVLELLSSRGSFLELRLRRT